MAVGRSGDGWRRLRVGLAALLALSSLMVFWPATGNDFIPYDDPVYVTKNTYVLEGFGVSGLRWSLTAAAGGSWHPVTWWSHMLDVSLFGRAAGGHHATSVIFHAASGALLFWFLAGATGALWPSFLASALFALHPLHVESVAWISERKDILAAFFWMLTLAAYLGYVRRPRRGGYLSVVGFFVLALMSKPMAVTLPLVLLLLDVWPLGRLPASDNVRGLARLAREKLPLLLPAAAVGILTIATQVVSGALEPISEVPAPFRTAMVSMRLLNAVYSYTVYLGQAVWPVDLAVFYPYPAHALTAQRSLAAGLFLVVVTVLAGRAQRRAPYLFVGWLWYLVTLVPAIGILQVGAQAHADRYTYLPLIGLFLLFSWGMRDLLARWPGLRSLILLLTAAALVAAAGLTVRQLGYWRDGTTLFRHALEVTRGNYLAYRNLGEIKRAEGDYPAAERYFRSELQISRTSSGAHNRLGVALTGQGRIQEAVVAYREAVRLNPDNYEARNNLGIHLAALGALPAADEQLRAALGLSPGTAEIHANLGDNLVRQGRVDEAVSSYRRALELNPGLTQVRSKVEQLLARPDSR